MPSTMRFRDPQEFLRHLQRTLRLAHRRGGGNRRYRRANLDRLAEARNRFPEVTIEHKDLGDTERIVDILLADIVPSLPAPVADRLKREVAIGGVDSPEANAYTLRSPDNRFAIVIYYGLMFLLNKFVKLTTAWNDPTIISFCDRKDPKSLTPLDIDGYARELLRNYQRSGIPDGALVTIDLDHALYCASIVHAAELFILCHEIGHFLNGDLENDSLFSAFDGVPDVQRFEENKDHAIEHAADVIGFGYYLTAFRRRFPGLPEYFPLLPVSMVFNLLRLLGGGASATHPDPTERTLRLAREYYSAEFAEFFRATYEEPSLLVRLVKGTAA